MQEHGKVPKWLESILSAQFFAICPKHADVPRSECNMFCIDCGTDAFCLFCRSSLHFAHRVLQIRRSSYHDVVRVAEIQKVMDVKEVQTYIINSDRVLFLNRRPRMKSVLTKGESNKCEICLRSLVDPYRFCSLCCKLEGMKGNCCPKVIISVNIEEKEDGLGAKASKKMNETQIRRTNSFAGNRSKSRRKGIPHRSPFF